MNFDAVLHRRLEAHREAALYRSRACLESPQGPHISVQGQRLLNFCSNDYLGLANHPRVVAAMQAAAARRGVGSGASHLVIGHSSAHHELEAALARITGRERALLFSSGYLANIGAQVALLGRGDLVVHDKLNHASLLDGARLSGATFRRYAHADTDRLRQRLEAGADHSLRLVVTDGVFSMDGDIAPLAGLATLCREYEAVMMVDDAHGFGVLGESGAGSLEHAGLSPNECPVLVGTLGKAMGTAGAFVAGSEALVETLIQFARSYIYTTAIPPAVAAATLEALAVHAEESWRRDRLASLVRRFREGAADIGLRLAPSETAIQPLLVGEPSRATDLSRLLREDGFLVSAIRPPTVPAGTARLRITLSAAHEDSDIDGLLHALARHTQS